MTCVIPSDIEQRLAARAAKRQTTIDEVVREALTWYLGVEEETFDELTAWQEIRDEAADLVEDSAP
jgi:plasmid stability protein